MGRRDGGPLSVHALRAGWPGGKVTEPLSVDLPRGARVAVVGESGSGKTTALMTMAGLLPPVAGTVRVDSVDVSDIDPAELRRHVGYFAEGRTPLRDVGTRETCASHAVTSPSRTRRKHLPQSVSASGWRNCRTGSTPTWSAACERFRAV